VAAPESRAAGLAAAGAALRGGGWQAGGGGLMLDGTGLAFLSRRETRRAERERRTGIRCASRHDTAVLIHYINQP
jgi:hypothetical protein